MVDDKNRAVEEELVQDHQEAGADAGNISRRGFITAAAGSMASLMGLPAASEASPPPTARQFRIHPAIGVARMGNADPGTYFIGPEAPGFGPLEEPTGWKHKLNGQIRPQAARFRIFEYNLDANGMWQPVGEVNLGSGNITAINWTVHLANKKASFYQFGGPAGETTPPRDLRNASVSDRSYLETDFGARSVSGPSASPAIFQRTGQPGETYPKKPDGSAVIDYLGQVRTDAAGRLIVIGGKGKAGYNTVSQPPLNTYANNDNWFDDPSDGPVTATVTIKNGNGGTTTFDALGAWVLVAPPDFAPQISNTVTMYDLLSDVAIRSIPRLPDGGLYAPGGPLNRLAQLKAAYNAGQPVEFPGVLPDFDTEVKPILQAGYNYYFVESLVPTKHDSLSDPTLGDPNPAYNVNRQFILGYMRPPSGLTGPSGKRDMPHILGDDAYNSHAEDSSYRLALTHTQYGMLTNWAAGNFIAAGNGPAPTTQITPWGLDRAALENCVGGAFFPGIEASWQIRNPALYLEPFRIDPNATSQYFGETGIPIGPGHFSRQMAVPWHADFNDCRSEATYAWWPGQRPDSVYVKSTGDRIDWARPDKKYANGGVLSEHLDMVANWYKFGYVMFDGSVYVETERNSGIK